MKRGGPLRRRTPLRSRPTPNEIPADVRAGVVARAGGRCERDGEPAPHGHLHHRKSRRFRDHSPSNLLYLCASCHSVVHAYPAETVAGRPAGYVLPGHAEPAAEPVWFGGRWAWVILGNDYEINEESAA